jgi:hypothetical protein
MGKKIIHEIIKMIVEGFFATFLGFWERLVMAGER